MSQAAVIYARVSIDDVGKGKKTKEEMQEVASISIESQLVAARKLAKDRKLHVIAELVDDGISGWKQKKERPGFQILLGHVIRGECNVIICRAVDRVGRNDVDNSNIRIESKKRNVEWLLLNGTTIDPSTAAGGLNMALTQSIAEYQSAVKSEAIRNVMEGMANRGEIQAPKGTFGYDDDDRSKLVPWEAEIIKKAYEAVGNGLSVGSVVREWNGRPKRAEDGSKVPDTTPVPQRKKGNGWAYPHLNSILLRARNAGLVEYHGEILEGVEGKWERIVEPELYYKVRTIIKDPSRRKSPGFQPVWLSSGLARCSVCGSVMRSNTVSDKRTGVRYSTLRCSRQTLGTGDDRRHPSARTEELDKLVRSAVIAAFTFGPANLIPQDETVDVSGLLASRAALTDRIEEIDYREKEGLYTTAQARNKLAEVRAERVGIDAAIEAAQTADIGSHMAIDLRREVMGGQRVRFDDVIELKHALGVVFDSRHIEEQRRLVATLLDITVNPGRGANKYVITHKVATSLNDDSDAA